VAAEERPLRVPTSRTAAARSIHPTRQGLWLALALAITLLGYLYHLDGRNILKNPDEGFYVQITRMTAEQGKLLPLVCERGICNDKPPLLFWQGIASTSWARHWSLWALRLPSVLYTAATALLVALLAGRLAGDRKKAWLAALLFTAARSTVQQGRPFLTNPPETFWLFAPLVVLLLAGELSWPVAVVSGICLGMGALYKSFFLIVPVTAAVGLIQWRRRRWDLREVLRQDAGRLATMAGIGLALFALWLAFDPYPGAIVHDFIGRENINKFRHTGYLRGLVSGKYSAITEIWLGDFTNFGFLVFALLGLVVMTLLRWRKGSAGGEIGAGDPSGTARVVDPDGPLTGAERDLWCYVVAFLVGYTAPHQRQDNYILPTVAALSVLLALRWERIPAWFLRLSGAAAAIFIGALAWLIRGLPHAVPDVTYAAWQVAGIGALVALALSAVVGTGAGVRWRLPAAAAGTWLALGLALSPFDGPFLPSPGGPGLEALRNRTILFPLAWPERHERHRFDVPGSQVASFDPRNAVATATLIDQGRLIALPIAPDASPPAGHAVYAQRLDLRIGISFTEVWEIVLRRRFDLLVQRLVIIE
jgi:4-amino-4-deoxy-L-arabinose transferase-like glycosyltransferase